MQHAVSIPLYPQFSEAGTGVQNMDDVHVLIFKTNIMIREDLTAIAGWLNYHPDIIRWSVDRDNVDHVLRIVSEKDNPEEIIELIKEAGYSCEELEH